MGFAITTPPLRFPDATGHYLRTAKVAANLFQHDRGASDAVWLPEPMATDVDYFTKRSPAVTRGHPFSIDQFASRLEHRQALASPALRTIPAQQMMYAGVGYLPQAIAFELSRLAGESFLVSVWAGRLAALLASVAVTILAIELMSSWARWTSVALSLLPMAAYMRASLSPDAMVNAAALLGIAAFLDGAGRREFPWRSAAVALLACLFLATVKPPYICILLLSLLWLPIGRIELAHPRVAIASIAAIWAATLAAAGWHSHEVAPYAAVIRPDLPPAAFAASVKLHLLLTSPFTVGAIFTKTLLAVPGMAYSMIARFGWSDINPHPLLHVLAIAWCIGVIYLDRYPIANNVSLRCATIMLATFLAQIILVFASLWVAWTATASPMITALQGRYFLPALNCGVLAIAALAVHPLLAKGKDQSQVSATLMPRLVGGGAALLLAASLVFVALGEFFGIQGFHVICLHELCNPG